MVRLRLIVPWPAFGQERQLTGVDIGTVCLPNLFI
jgi:hypothetical protein